MHWNRTISTLNWKSNSLLMTKRRKISRNNWLLSSKTASSIWQVCGPILPNLISKNSRWIAGKQTQLLSRRSLSLQKPPSSVTKAPFSSRMSNWSVVSSCRLTARLLLRSTHPSRLCPVVVARAAATRATRCNFGALSPIQPPIWNATRASMRQIRPSTSGRKVTSSLKISMY